MFHIELTDTDLWNAIRSDDQHAFNRLFDKYWVSVYKTGYKYLKDKEASQEIVHDIFLSIWNRRHTLEIASFRSFLLTATRYQIYSRQKSKQTFVTVANETLGNEFMSYSEADTKIRQSELYQQLNSTLLQLPKRCQEIFRLSRFEYMSNDEIAIRLGISKRTVENQLTMALKHLRLHIKNGSVVILLLILINAETHL
ncbi:RNA polymerase sigma-70 factor [Chitinophaga silvatica]|uniref:RNA polymerase sigma-70 factor n=1 Tax=Chitinophaga silvatica TaxID=2282649 RepID=A0A3E1YG04_9BACT|nr:RNA polymerase sigma-70 factor [Chitinophaga silvatica]RFS26309.1 RNA polymerase sigma-70 factor [Chitinophaga silvatica]